MEEKKELLINGCLGENTRPIMYPRNSLLTLSLAENPFSLGDFLGIAQFVTVEWFLIYRSANLPKQKLFRDGCDTVTGSKNPAKQSTMHKEQTYLYGYKIGSSREKHFICNGSHFIFKSFHSCRLGLTE